VYRGYAPDGGNWVGWTSIGAGCLMLAAFSSFNIWLLVPSVLIVLGFRLAESPLDLWSVGGYGGYGGDGEGDLSGSYRRGFVGSAAPRPRFA
jgi:hypothetical protein